MGDLIDDIWSLYVSAAKDSGLCDYLARLIPGPVEQLRKLEKADEAYDTSNITGYDNVMFGAMVYDQVNREQNAHAILPKVAWPKTRGLRILNGTPSNKGSGVSEGGALPDTGRVDVTEVYSEPAWMMSTWEITDQLLFQAAHDDGIGNLEAFKRAKWAEFHGQLLNETLLVDAEGEASSATANTTNAKGSDIESLDRMISNDSEEDAFGGSYTGWYDVYNGAVDRDSAGIGECVVSHNSGTDRALTLGLIDSVLQELEDNGAKRKNLVMLTGRDTLTRIKQLVGPQWKIDMPTFEAALTINGVQSASGANVDLRVRSYEDIPIFVDKNVPSDGISRIYFIDRSAMEIRVVAPTLYLKTSDKILLDELKNKYAYLTVEQLYCTNFKTQGKIRDLE